MTCCPPCADNEHAGDLDNPGYCDCCGAVLTEGDYLQDSVDIWEV